MKPMQRRTFVKAMALAGGAAAVHPAFGSTLGGLDGGTGASRKSRLDASKSLTLVHSDLHNHSFISGDAEGDPYKALHHLKAAGLDVACMTEHAVSGGYGLGDHICSKWQDGGCRFITGIDDDDWQTMAKIADEAYEPGKFVSFRGFEYSTPTIGHISVFFGQDFTDPLHEAALVTGSEVAQAYRVFPPLEPISPLFAALPNTAEIAPFYEWLTNEPGTGLLGGGADAIASFNHPGYFGNFQNFLYHHKAAKQIFLIEGFNAITFNGGDSHDATDYFWYGRDSKLPQPFNACFNAGWKVGFSGVSDEHSGTYGQTGKGRGGLYVKHLTREGVRRAIMTRRTFGTREPALRIDATANGVPMGSELAHHGKPLHIKLDIDRGPGWVGKKLHVQLIGPGKDDPTLLDVIPIEVPGADNPVIEFTAKPRGSWLFMRICDPKRANDPLGVKPFEDATFGGATAYVSPWFFRDGA
jgi:hypothetical protein